ncbi:SRPBCC family protein [Streptosporangium sp. KLBMP 9127]|nr:carbon monoxide dehydrogenase subunit G [Streptosporangium sp. KLBMP 9127]
MKVVGSALLGVERRRLWTALRDPAVLVTTIPGCERLEALGDDAYRMTVSAGVASIKGVYQGEVALSDLDEPGAFVLKASGQGAPGTVDATVQVRLTDAEGGTRVDYDAEAVVGGMIGGVGQRMLGSVAKRTAAEFFTAVESHLTALAAPVGEPPAVAGTATPIVSGTATPIVPGMAEHGAVAGEPGRPVYSRPGKEVRPGVPAWSLLAAFGMGAGVALGSAVIGWLLGRGGRRG